MRHSPMRHHTHTPKTKSHKPQLTTTVPFVNVGGGGEGGRGMGLGAVKLMRDSPLEKEGDFSVAYGAVGPVIPGVGKGVRR